MLIPSGLERDAWEINNPALGSYMLWTFSRASFDLNKKPIHPSKLFCLFAFIFYSDTRDILTGTRSSLQAYISKFYSTKLCATDIPLSLHFRVNMQKERTLDSLIIALDSGLLYIDTNTGMITPNMELKPIAKLNMDNTTKELFDCSVKLGAWLSNLTTKDLTRIIKVVY